VLVGGAEWAVIRPRPSLEEIITRDRVPDWVHGRVDAPAHG